MGYWNKLLLQNKHKKCINSSETVAYGNDIAEDVSILYGGSVKPECKRNFL
jgi:triosephosphate isomerase